MSDEDLFKVVGLKNLLIKRSVRGYYFTIYYLFVC